MKIYVMLAIPHGKIQKEVFGVSADKAKLEGDGNNRVEFQTITWFEIVERDSL